MIAKVDFIEGAAKAFAVLESFDTQRQKLNATQAAERAGMTRAAARRHLLTLTHLGYLECVEGYYWLSPKVLRLSGSYLSSARLPRVVQPMLNKLSVLTGHAFSVAVREQDDAVIVARSSGVSRHRSLIAHGLHLGARLALTATSTGRILLAAMPVEQWTQWTKQRHLQRYTVHTLVEWDAFESAIKQVREKDFCWVEQEHELGVQALAVPLRNLSGQTVAALNVVLAVSDYEHPESCIETFLPDLRQAASELLPLL